jgi:hypothetical protein
LILCATLLATAAVHAAEVANLRCEGRTDPIGIDTPQPALSWNINSALRGDLQTKYEVLVASSPAALAAGKGDLWDSGAVPGDQSLYLAYAGKPLASLETCWWKVRIWDRRGKPTAWSNACQWTMGLLTASDWQGQWITASRWFMPPQYRPPGFETIPEHRPDYPCWAAVDLGSAIPIDTVKLYPNGAERFPLRFRIEAADDIDFDSPKVVADQTAQDFQPGKGPWDRGPARAAAHPQIASRPVGSASPAESNLPEHRPPDGSLVRRTQRRADAAYIGIRAHMEQWSRGLHG